MENFQWLLAKNVIKSYSIAPHPDDEVLGPGGFIRKAVEQGKEVHVVLVTTGDGYQHTTQVFFHKHRIQAS
jgi:LmbE family N-acetylglucosaminyl deacetylase